VKGGGRRGEKFYQCQNRIVGTIDAILSGHKPQDIVACFLHADPNKLAVAYYIGLPLDQFQRLGCDTASVSVLAIGEMGASLMKLNQRPPFDFLPKKK
jgi:probable phosphoglycerate mutase